MPLPDWFWTDEPPPNREWRKFAKVTSFAPLPFHDLPKSPVHIVQTVKDGMVIPSKTSGTLTIKQVKIDFDALRDALENL